MVKFSFPVFSNTSLTPISRNDIFLTMNTSNAASRSENVHCTQPISNRANEHRRTPATSQHSVAMSYRRLRPISLMNDTIEMQTRDLDAREHMGNDRAELDISDAPTRNT